MIERRTRFGTAGKLEHAAATKAKVAPGNWRLHRERGSGIDIAGAGIGLPTGGGGVGVEKSINTRDFLLLSDFDQTLSFKDSGQVLAEMMGISDFQEHVHRLSDTPSGATRR